MEAEIEAARGIDSCPNCGSADVRWRKRRWYDVIRTWLRHVAEMFIHTLTGGSRSGATIPGAVPTNCDTHVSDVRTDRMVAAANLEAHYANMREIHDSNVSTATAGRFWACRKCVREGHEFDDPERLLALRGVVADLEDQVFADMGAPHDPIDRDGL